MTEERQVTISASQLNALGCRLQWHWGYRRGYRTPRRNINLLLGDGIHQALEAFYKGKVKGNKRKDVDPVPVFERWAEEELKKLDPRWGDDIQALQEAKDLGVAMLQGYVDYAAKNDDFEVLATEHTLRRPLPIPGGTVASEYYMVVRLDALVRDSKTGKLFSLEHKTLSRFDAGHLDRDHQITGQVWAGQQLADTLKLKGGVAGVIYNGLRKQAPSARVHTDLFIRRKIFRTEHEVNVLLHRAYWQIYEAQQKNFQIFPQPDAIRCNMCEFQGPCLAYMRGDDYQFMLDELYTSRAQRPSHG